ncbi:MAG: DUF2291 domain-containing protein [Chitinispirillia bacterium]|jgi:predicted lipoprotein
MKQKSGLNNCILLKYLFIIITIKILLFINCEVVKLKDKTSERGYKIYFENEDFNADKIVNDMWDSRIIPYINQKSRDVIAVVNELLKDKENAGKMFGSKIRKEGEPWNFIVAGEGIIKKLDTTSRVRKIILDIPSIKNAEVIIQIGPVIKGTSIRDSFDFISFDQFTNQIEFASISNSLNKRVVGNVLKDIQFSQKIGKTLKFSGAFTMPDDPSKIIITPVKVELM